MKIAGRGSAMNFVRAKRCLLLAIVVVIVAGCARGALTQAPAATLVTATYWPTAGWRSSTPEEQGVDSGLLSAMMGEILEENHAIDSVTIVRNGYIIADARIHPFNSTSKHNIYSCTKSVVSALVGIAIDQGYIEGLQQPVLSFFPQQTIANRDANKKAMTLEHLLTMTTGFRCQDSYLYLPMEGEPGERFEYCNGASHLLSGIIQETTGMSANDYAVEHLFGPLGISDVDWSSSPQGISVGYSELRMRPQDMAKIGLLYLNEGRWDGERIVPSEWVVSSTSQFISATLEDGYGYQWWVDMVVVFTSSLEDNDFYVPQRLLNEFIIPAAVTSSSLPDNSEGVALLESNILELTNP